MDNKIIFSLLLLTMMCLIIYMSSYYLLNSQLYTKKQNMYEVECGIVSLLNKNSSSMIFFMFVIVFLVFDLELVLLFVLINNYMKLFFLEVLLLILISLILELHDTSLKWTD